jgi:hypothetical protein
MSKHEGRRLAGPISFSGPAAEREARMRDKNDGKRPDVAQWIRTAEQQADEISGMENEFVSELRKRVS